MVGRFAACFEDGRDAGLVEHTVATMVAQRVFGIALGYEDLGAGVSLQEEVDQQPFDRRAVVADLVVPARLRRRVLEPIECALAGERRTALPLGAELADERREHRVVAQLIVMEDLKAVGKRL